MNAPAIVSALRNAVEAVGELVRADDTHLALLVHYSEKEDEKSNPTIVKLIDLLKNTPELEIFDGRMQVLPNEATRVEIGNLAAWMIRRALEAEPNQVVADLERYVEVEEIPCLLVFALSG